MRRIAVLLAVLLGLLVSACAPADTPVPVPTGTTVQATNAPQAEATKESTKPIGQPEATKPVATPEASTPQATPNIDKIVHPQPDDWKRGPDGASITIIEWGDFQ
jgi:hypothetical protein